MFTIHNDDIIIIIIIIVYYAREAATINTNYTMKIYKKHLHNKMQY